MDLTVPQTIRRVEGITYWIVSNPAEIRKFINRNIRNEWERDAESDGKDPRRDIWLLGLSKLKWSLRKVRTESVRLNSSMMRRKAFVDRLKERSDQLRREIELYDTVIWPIVLKGGDNLTLKDGFCRFNTLKEMGISKTLAYIGL